MDYILISILLLLTIVLYKFIFKINYKKTKLLQNNKEIEKLTNRFPNNIDIAKEMLEILNNSEVKVEEAQNTQTSLYIAITNKISIADMKDNYARIQTIAHECIHSCQDRTLLLFNFIFSNIFIVYFLIITIFTIFKHVSNPILQIVIIMLFTLIQFSVRAFLEIDAMTKSKFLAKEYMESKDIITKQEQEAILSEYEKINKIGIPFVLDNLLTSKITIILTYIIVAYLF